MKTQKSVKAHSVLESLDFVDVAAIALSSDRGRVALANRAALELFGYTAAEMEGRDIASLVPGFLFEHTDGRRTFRAVCLTRSGARLQSDVTVVPATDEASGTGAILFVVPRTFSPGNGQTSDYSDTERSLSVFNYLARAFARHMEIDAVLKDFVRHLPSLIGAEAAWVHLCGDDEDLALVFSEGIPAESIRKLERLASQSCLIGKVYTQGRPLLVKDIPSDSRVTHVSARESGLRSMASVPIFSSRKTWGVLTVGSTAGGYFTAHDMKMLSVVGNQLGVAIENSRLITQLHGRMEQIEIINEISNTLSSSLSLGSVFRIMVTELKKLVRFERASLLLFDEREQLLRILALDTAMATQLPKGMYAPLDTTSAGWALKNNKPYINRDLAESIEFSHDRKLFEDGIRSTISLPLYQDKAIGVFNLDSTEPLRYSEQDIELLTPVSKQLSIALQNSLLFEEVSREKKEWEKTFDAITDMVWIEDTDRQVLRANKELLDKANLSVSELKGMHCTKLLKRIGIRSEHCLCAMADCSRRQTHHEIKEADGTVYHFWAYPLVDTDGKAYATVHYLKDVTSQKRMEQQLVRNEKLASLGILAAGVAHEINNPLGIIAGYAEALLDRADDQALMKVPAFEDFPEYLDTIQKEIFRCKEIIVSLLEFAMPHAAKSRELDINELIKEVILLVNHKAKSQSHNFDMHLNRELPKIYADAGSLRQLFLNIIINAMYFTSEGGDVEIRTGLEEAPADGGAPEGKRMITVDISDSGKGIPKESLNRIFDPFFTTKPPGEGTGLGLSICHRIAQEHGGFIDVTSEPGKGTTFTIKLPAGQVYDD